MMIGLKEPEVIFAASALEKYSSTSFYSLLIHAVVVAVSVAASWELAVVAGSKPSHLNHPFFLRVVVSYLFH